MPRFVDAAEILLQVFLIGALLDNLMEMLRLLGKLRDRVAYAVTVAVSAADQVEQVFRLAFQHVRVPREQLAGYGLAFGVRRLQDVVELFVGIANSRCLAAQPAVTALIQAVDQLMNLPVHFFEISHQMLPIAVAPEYLMKVGHGA